jgi:hypothetical protein
MKKKDYLLSMTELKNILKQQTKENLVSMVAECYKNSDKIKELISVKYAGNDAVKQIFEGYKIKIQDVFFPDKLSGRLMLSEARKAISDFKKLCNDEELILDLMLFYVETGVEATNTYGDLYEEFYNSVEKMYLSVIETINNHKDSRIFSVLSKRLKAVVDDTGGIGWGFHDNLTDMYQEIKWLEIGDIGADTDELGKIKEYISERLAKRADIPELKDKPVNEIVSGAINADEVFLSKMDKQHRSYSNDEEMDFIEKRTDIEHELIELILWQRYCYEMENDYWEYTEGKCKNCGSSELYIKEVPDEDFADKIICKKCGTEYIRE